MGHFMNQRIRLRLRRVVTVAILAVIAFQNSTALAQSGGIPLNDLDSGLYLGQYQGGPLSEWRQCPPGGAWHGRTLTGD